MTNEPNETALPDPINELFDERDNKLPLKEQNIIVEKEDDKNLINKTPDMDDLDEEIPSDKKKDHSTKMDSINKNSSLKEESKELENAQKRLEDNQNYSRTLRQNRDSALSFVNKLLDEGDLPEEQANQLISILKSNISKEPEGLSASDKKENISHPFQKFFDIANHEVMQIYLDVTEDDNYRDKINAFDAYMTDASQEELEELYKDLGNLEKKPISLLKKMLSVGQDYLDEGYSDYQKAGGFRKYSSIKKDEIEVLQNKVDKLSKKLAQYESYDKPTYSLEEASESTNKNQKSDDILTQIFNERDAVRRR